MERVLLQARNGRKIWWMLNEEKDLIFKTYWLHTKLSISSMLMAYTQLGSETLLKEKLWEDLEGLVQGIQQEEKIPIGSDLNCAIILYFYHDSSKIQEIFAGFYTSEDLWLGFKRTVVTCNSPRSVL